MKRKEIGKAFRAAFPPTIPIFIGFAFLGIAFGLLMKTKGYGIGWTLAMSLFIFAGSMQFVTISLLGEAFQPLYAFFLTIMVNARHLFYGISLLEKYRGTGKFKPFLIFGLTDEAFSVLSLKEAPEGVDRRWYMFFVTFLIYVYWNVSCAAGAFLGSFIHFDTRGLDFVLTALFVVIFVNQWREKKDHLPALIGVGASVLALIIFGPDRFLPVAMVLILLALTLCRKRIERGEGQ